MQVITLLYCGRGFWEILRHCLSFFFLISLLYLYGESALYKSSLCNIVVGVSGRWINARNTEGCQEASQQPWCECICECCSLTFSRIVDLNRHNNEFYSCTQLYHQALLREQLPAQSCK